jgi:glycine/D-amino acid oxidase-like deaminating enzyme
MEPHDELGFIGRNPGHEDNVYIVTGDSGNGITYATIAAMMLPDLIAGRREWSDGTPASAVGTAPVTARALIAWDV